MKGLTLLLLLSFLCFGVNAQTPSRTTLCNRFESEYRSNMGLSQKIEVYRSMVLDRLKHKGEEEKTEYLNELSDKCDEIMSLRSIAPAGVDKGQYSRLVKRGLSFVDIVCNESVKKWTKDEKNNLISLCTSTNKGGKQPSRKICKKSVKELSEYMNYGSLRRLEDVHRRMLVSHILAFTKQL